MIEFRFPNTVEVFYANLTGLSLNTALMLGVNLEAKEALSYKKIEAIHIPKWLNKCKIQLIS